MAKCIVTINRQYGSGGREIGKLLAGKLGIPFFDKELISLAAKESGFTETIFENADEKPSNSLLYSIVTGSYNPQSWFFGTGEVLTNDTLFNIQAEIIRKVAAESCVIVGRCANFILREDPALISVFTHAPAEYRQKYAAEENQFLKNAKAKEVENYVRKTDKSRSNYYSYYTNRQWDSAINYDLVIDTSKIGVETSVKLIEAYIEMKSAKA